MSERKERGGGSLVSGRERRDWVMNMENNDKEEK